MTTLRSVRLSALGTSSLSNNSGNNGEVFYDSTNKTLRLFDGRTRGGYQLLRADLSNISGSFGASISLTPPNNPQAGTQWIKSDTGVLYIYWVDSAGGHWVQPITTPVGTQQAPVTLQVASVNRLGAVSPDGNTITVSEDGTISALISATFTNSNFIGVTTTHLPASIVNTIINADGVVNLDIQAAGNTFYFITAAGNFTANFINVPTVQNRSYTMSLVIAQVTPAVIPAAVQINGTPYSISWVNNLVPTGTPSNTDIVSITLLNLNGTWSVTGSLATHGA